MRSSSTTIASARPRIARSPAAGASHDGGRAARLYPWAFLALVLLLCVPVLAVRYPPLADYPNHLARAFILFHYGEVPAFQAEYLRVLAPIPNVALDVAFLGLFRVLSVEAASRVFLVLLVLLFALGCHLLGRAIQGRPTWMALPCACMVYSSTFFYGFVNYVAGVALFCLALAVWLQGSRGWTAARLAGAVLLFFLAYLSHLTAYASLGLAVVFYTAWGLRAGTLDARRAALGLLPLLPPLLAFAGFMRGNGRVGQVRWNSWMDKLAGLLTPITTYSHRVDLGVCAGLALAALLLLAGARRITVDPPALLLGAVFFLLFLAAPLTLLTASAVDVRFVLPAVILALLSVRVDAGGAAAAGALAIFALVIVGRMGFILHTWKQLDTETRREVAAFDSLPEGARIYPITVESPDWETAKRERGLESVAHYATIRRHAFLPTLFAYRGQQPLFYRVRPRYVAGGNASDPKWLRQIAGYDYVWARGADASLLRDLAGRCASLTRAGEALLCELRR
jgi:hypothetical protein